MEQKTVKTWTGRQHLEYRYRWYNGVELRAEQPTLTVNYLSLEIWNEEKGKVTIGVNLCGTKNTQLRFSFPL